MPDGPPSAPQTWVSQEAQTLQRPGSRIHSDACSGQPSLFVYTLPSSYRQDKVMDTLEAATFTMDGYAGRLFLDSQFGLAKVHYERALAYTLPHLRPCRC